MRESIYAVFGDVEDAQRALGALLDHGAKSEDISLVIKEPYVAHFNETEPRAENVRSSALHGISTTTPEDAGVGATKGAEIGLGLGAIAALAALMVPGIGLVVGGGALGIALMGTAATTAGGAVVGGVTGYLKDQGVHDEEVAEYVESFESGAAVLTITVPSGNLSATEARSVIEKYKAHHRPLPGTMAPSDVVPPKHTVL